MTITALMTETPVTITMNILATKDQNINKESDWFKIVKQTIKIASNNQTTTRIYDE